MKKRRALCLQGGGAKGAYQAGALKALAERGYRFDCAVGASVGSINAAMYALGKTDELFDLWKELDFADVFPVSRKGEGQGLSVLSVAATAIDAIRNGGVDTSRIRAILEKHLDEQALRRSNVRFGLVTVRGEGEKGVLERRFIEDIPEGKLVDYVMASSALPFFRKVMIDGVRYYDGGILDNLPIEMLAKAGYRDVTAIRLGGDLRYAGEEDLHVTYIDPSEGVGHTINFSNASITNGLHLGYFDILRMTDGLLGDKYYIRRFGRLSLKWFLFRHRRFVNKALDTLGVNVGSKEGERIAALSALLAEKLKVASGGFVDVWAAFAEFVAQNFGLERWRIYDWKEIFSLAAGAEQLSKEAGNADSKLLAVAKLLLEEVKNER